MEWIFDDVKDESFHNICLSYVYILTTKHAVHTIGFPDHDRHKSNTENLPPAAAGWTD